MRWVPHDYQRKAIRFIIDKACAGLFLDPGLGKTSIMLAAFKIMKAKGYVKRMLVVTPLRPMQSTWPGEVAKWDEFNGLHLNVLHGPGKELFINDGPAYDIDVINPEGLPWLFSYPMKWWPWDVLCVDESTRFKHTTPIASICSSRTWRSSTAATSSLAPPLQTVCSTCSARSSSLTWATPWSGSSPSIGSNTSTPPATVVTPGYRRRIPRNASTPSSGRWCCGWTPRTTSSFLRSSTTGWRWSFLLLP